MEHVVDDNLLVVDRVADADFEAAEGVSSQVGLDGFDAVVAAAAAFGADADEADGQVHVVLDYSDVFGGNVIEAGEGTYGPAAFVHVGCGFDDEDFFTVEPVFRNHGIFFRFVEADVVVGCKPVRHHEAHVVSGVLIFLADVAKSCN